MTRSTKLLGWGFRSLISSNMIAATQLAFNMIISSFLIVLSFCSFLFLIYCCYTICNIAIDCDAPYFARIIRRTQGPSFENLNWESDSSARLFPRRGTSIVRLVITWILIAWGSPPTPHTAHVRPKQDRSTLRASNPAPARCPRDKRACREIRFRTMWSSTAWEGELPCCTHVRYAANLGGALNALKFQCA